MSDPSRMDPRRIIHKYYEPGSTAEQILVAHSAEVANMAARVASRLDYKPDEIRFIQEASMLHDIGIRFTLAPELGCNGKLPYICHGFQGHDLLVAEGLPKHALVCERHTGTGLDLSETQRFNGLLPVRPMVPVSRAEILIAYCDKFFSKDPERIGQLKSVDQILDELSVHGRDKAERFLQWHRIFNP